MSGLFISYAHADATLVDRLVADLRAVGLPATSANPSVLRQLADEQLAGRLHIEPRHVGTSAERLDEATRRRAHEAFGLHVFDTYGATEYAPIATECAAGSLHLLEDSAVIELVDDRGHAAPPGAPGARLLLTCWTAAPSRCCATRSATRCASGRGRAPAAARSDASRRSRAAPRTRWCSAAR